MSFYSYMLEIVYDTVECRDKVLQWMSLDDNMDHWEIDHKGIHYTISCRTSDCRDHPSVHMAIVETEGTQTTATIIAGAGTLVNPDRLWWMHVHHHQSHRGDISKLGASPISSEYSIAQVDRVMRHMWCVNRIILPRLMPNTFTFQFEDSMEHENRAGHRRMFCIKGFYMEIWDVRGEDNRYIQLSDEDIVVKDIVIRALWGMNLLLVPRLDGGYRCPYGHSEKRELIRDTNGRYLEISLSEVPSEV